MRSKLLYILLLMAQACVPSGDTRPADGIEEHKGNLLLQITSSTYPDNSHQQTSTIAPNSLLTPRIASPAEKKSATRKVRIRTKKRIQEQKSKHVPGFYQNLLQVYSNQAKISTGFKVGNDSNKQGTIKSEEIIRSATAGNITEIREIPFKLDERNDTFHKSMVESLQSGIKTLVDVKPGEPIVLTKVKNNTIIINEKPKQSKDIGTQLISPGKSENETSISAESTTTPINSKLELTTNPYFEVVESVTPVYTTSNVPGTTQRGKRVKRRMHTVGAIPTRKLMMEGNFVSNFKITKLPVHIWEDHGPDLEVYGKWKPPVELRQPYTFPPPPPPDDYGSEYKDMMKPIRKAQEEAFYASTPYPLRFKTGRKDWLLEVTSELLEDLNTKFVSTDPIPQDPESELSIEEVKPYRPLKTLNVKRVTIEEVENLCPEAKPCHASDDFAPVCGSDGQTYLNVIVFLCAQKCNISLTRYSWAPCLGVSEYTTTTNKPRTRSTPGYEEYKQMDLTNDTKAIVKLVFERNKLTNLPGYKRKVNPIPDYVGIEPLAVRWEFFVCRYFSYWCHTDKMLHNEYKPWQMLNQTLRRPIPGDYILPEWVPASFYYKLHHMTFNENWDVNFY
ncbi:unnamed protein product [Orchesella dallaii]|uniref:Kazal-like domain-containing protein n=1 Tax=Orchesella dallaii TaxID=48710 RepID=A0ABP1PUZ2_9HEXA